MMKKVHFEMPEFETEDNHELIHQLQTSEKVIQLLKKMNRPLSEVEKYPYKFNKWVTEVSKCDHCKGLSFCKQNIQGQYMDLSYDGLWMNVVRFCKYQLEKEKNTEHLQHYLVCDLPQKFTTISLNQTGQNQESMDENLLNNMLMVGKWLKGDQEKGLYLYGPVGTGKSYLAACVSNRFAKDGKKVVFVNVPEWVQRMKTYFSHPEEMAKEISRIKRAEFAVFDDIGAESVTSWVRDELLFPVLNHRMENKRLTWFTSNEDFESLENHFQNTKNNQEEKVKAIRIMERVKTLSNPCKILGKNRRNTE